MSIIRQCIMNINSEWMITITYQITWLTLLPNWSHIWKQFHITFILQNQMTISWEFDIHLVDQSAYFFYVQRLMRYQTEDGRSQLGKQPGQQLCVRFLWTFSHIPLSYSTSLLSREIYSFPIFDFFPRLTRSWNIERYPAFQYSQRRDVFVEFLSRSHLEPYELLLSRNGDVDWCWETDS